jgi:prepilin-type N-terminal cleavage/methylation domain-containing protein
MFTPRLSSGRGFTLIETLVAVSLFSVLMVMTVGSLTVLIDANRKARSEKSVINNLNAALEIMSRSIRDGSGYQCQPNIRCTGANNQLSFVTKSGNTVIYRLRDGAIERSVDGGSQYTNVTGPDIEVQTLAFESVGSLSDVPKFQISINAASVGEVSTGAQFNLQTTVAQRYTFQAPITVSRAECGNRQCEWDEDDGSCPNDCSVTTFVQTDCNNDVCEWGEDAARCPDGCKRQVSVSPLGGDVMLVLDNSGSMAADDMAVLKQSVNYLIDEVFDRSPQTRIGVVTYSNWATLVSHMTSNQNALKSEVNRALPEKGKGTTNTPLGLRAALNEYRTRVDSAPQWNSETAVPNGTVDAKPFAPGTNRPNRTSPNHVILITDGATNSFLAHTPTVVNGVRLKIDDWVNKICPPGDAGVLTVSHNADPPPPDPCTRGTVKALESLAREARELKRSATIHVIAVGLRANLCDGTPCDAFLRTSVATAPGTYHELPAFDTDALNAIIRRIMDNTGNFTEQRIDCTGCANGGTCDSECVKPTEETTTVTIDCTECRSGGVCPVACVAPPIQATTSRPINIEEF